MLAQAAANRSDARNAARHQTLTALRDFYGYRMFAGAPAEKLKAWLVDWAEQAPLRPLHFRVAWGMVAEYQGHRT